MSILVFADVDFPNGMATTAHNSLLVKGFRDNGASSFLLIPFGSANAKELNNNLIKGHQNGVPFFFLNGKAGLSKSHNLFSMFYGMCAASRLVFKRWKQKKKDVVIIYSPDFIKYFVVIITCFLLRIPIFPWQVEKMTTQKRSPGIKSLIKLLSGVLSEKLLPRFSSGIIVISSFLKKYYNKYFNDNRIIISPILVNPSVNYKIHNKQKIKEFRAKYQSKRIIVYSGTFGEKDGFPFIIDAFKKFVEKYPDSLLITTGKPSKNMPMENILQEINEKGLNGYFKYLGLVSREELQLINNAADLLLVCRSDSTFANYGFPWKLGEYCMTSNPIIATKVGDIEIYFKDEENIYIAEPENIISIYSKMKLVFGDYQNALKVAGKGYENACKVFNYRQETKNIIDFLSYEIYSKKV